MDHQLALQVAYQISEEVGTRSVEDLFFAIDRFWFDQAETEDGRIQRSEARTRIARELDRRGVPVRDPRAPLSYPPRS